MKKIVLVLFLVVVVAYKMASQQDNSCQISLAPSSGKVVRDAKFSKFGTLIELVHEESEAPDGCHHLP